MNIFSQSWNRHAERRLLRQHLGADQPEPMPEGDGPGLGRPDEAALARLRAIRDRTTDPAQRYAMVRQYRLEQARRFFATNGSGAPSGSDELPSGDSSTPRAGRRPGPRTRPGTTPPGVETEDIDTASSPRVRPRRVPPGSTGEPRPEENPLPSPRVRPRRVPPGSTGEPRPEESPLLPPGVRPRRVPPGSTGEPRPEESPRPSPRVRPRTGGTTSSTSETTPRLDLPNPSPRPTPVETPRNFSRLNYGPDAQAFIASRINWVRTEADNPESQFRRFTQIMTLRTRATLDNALGESDGLKLTKSGTEYTLEWTDGATVRKFKIREFVSGTSRLVFVGDPDALMQTGGSTAELFPFNRMDTSAIKSKLRTAVTRRASESADAAGVARFDLPRGEPILYTGVFDQTDPTEENHARHFGSFLGSLGGGSRYNVVGSGNDTFPATSNLLDVLEARFDGALGRGIKNHYLYFSVHGDTNAVYFTTPDRRQLRIEPAALMALFNKPKFRDCRFTLRMNCCNSGGFRSGEMAALFRAPGEAGRISVFIQTKPELPNPIRTTDASLRLPDGTRSRNFDTPYDYYLVKFLSEGLTYGEAHRRADEETKKNFPGLDAGVFRSGESGGTETALRTERESGDVTV